MKRSMFKLIAALSVALALPAAASQESDEIPDTMAAYVQPAFLE